MNHYLIWATGKDRPGFVCAITKFLFDHDCNLEDSSMMRLGSEFAMFVIVSSEKSLSENIFSKQRALKDVNVGLKKISSAQARFQPSKKQKFIVRVHGPDQPGIVYFVTEALANQGFNITDVSTHRTTAGTQAGFIVLLEGEFVRSDNEKRLRSNLAKLGRQLRAKITLEALATQTL